jgi:hypothetical protein
VLLQRLLLVQGAPPYLPPPRSGRHKCDAGQADIFLILKYEDHINTKNNHDPAISIVRHIYPIKPPEGLPIPVRLSL